MLASEGSAAPIAELSSDRARVLGRAGGDHRLGAARRLRRRAPARDADAGQLDARRSADLRRHRPAGDGLGGRRARRCWRRARRSSCSTSAAASRGATARSSAWAPSPRPRRGRRGSRWSPRSRTSPPSRPGTWASRCASTAPRWRAASSTCPPGGRARKRFVHTVSGGARQAEVVIDHDGFALDDRRACRVEASRGLRVLLVDGDPRTVRTEDEAFFLEAALRAGGSNFSVTTVLPDDARQPRPRRLRRRVHGQRRPAERRRSRPRSPATSRAAAACSSRSAIASTSTPGTRR